MIGDVQHSYDPMSDTERRIDKNFHENFIDSRTALNNRHKAPPIEINPHLMNLNKNRKKISTNQVLTAGGTGGGIR